MPSTYTLNNGIELIGTGEQSGTWGDTTNTNLELLDTALDGQVTITATSAGTSSSPNDLPISDGATSNGRNRMIIITSATDLGADVYYQLTPNDSEKIIYVRNDLNAQDLILFQGTYNASNDYVVPNGTTAVIFFDGAGTGAVAANVFNNAHFDNLNIAGDITIKDSSPAITFIDTSVTNLQHKINSSSDNLAIRADENDVDSGSRVEILNASTSNARFTKTENNFNEGSADLDFRIESTNNPNMLFVDAGNDRVAIGTNTQSAVLTIESAGNTYATGSLALKGAGISDTAYITNAGGSLYLSHDGTNDDVVLTSGDTVFNETGVDRNFRVETSGSTDMLYIDGGTDQVNVGTSGDLGGTFNTLGLIVAGSEAATGGGALIATRYNGAGGLGTGDFLGTITNEKATGAIGLSYGLYGDTVAQGYLSAYDNFSGGRAIVEVAQSNIRIKNQRTAAATAVGTSVTLQELAKFTTTKSHFNDDGADLDFIIETAGHANAFNVNASENHISFFGTSNAAMDGVRGVQIGDSSSTSTGLGMATANHSFLMYIDNSNDLFSLYDSTNNVDRMQLLNDGTFVFNQTGAANADFRIESNGSQYAFFVDSGNSRVAIGTSTATSGVAGNGLRIQSNAVGSASAAALSLGGTGGDFYGLTYYNNATNYITHYAVSSGSTNYIDTIFTDAGQSITDTNRHRLYSTGSVDYTPADDAGFVWNQGSADANFRIESNDANAMFFVDGGSNRVGINTSAPGAPLDVQPSSGTMQPGGIGVIRARPIYSGNRFFSAFQAMGSVSGASATGGMHIGAISDNNGDITSGQYYNSAGLYVPVSTSATKISMSGETIVFYADASLTVGTGHYPTELMQVNASGVVINEQSYDRDFRVESDDRTYALHVDSARDYVGIGGQHTGTTALYVQGGISTGGGLYDPVLGPNISKGSHHSDASGGSIEAVYGFQGTGRSGSTFVIEYAANLWKSWAMEIQIASTRGLARVNIGGYNNQSTQHTVYTDDNSNMITSVSYTTTSTVGANQGNQVTITMSGSDVHPMLTVKYSQTGGDSVPRGDRLYVSTNY